MQINKTKNAVRNMAFGTLQKIINIIMPFISRTVMLYVLGAEYLGLNSLFISVLQVLNLAELGVGSAMIYSMYKPIAEDDKDTICALMRLYKMYYRIIGIVILIVGVCITPGIPRLIKQDIPNDINIYILYLINLGSTVLSYWLFAYKNSLLYAHQRNDIIDKTSSVVICLQQIIQMIVLIFFKNYYAYLLVVLAAQTSKNIINASVVNRMFPEYKAHGRLPKMQVKAINQRVRDLFTAKLGGTVISSADALVISTFMGLNMLAIYNNYYFIMNSVSTFVFMIFTACSAGIGNSIVTASKEKNFKDFNTLTFIVSWIVGTCICCFYSLYQPFMKIWVGEELMFNQVVVVLFCIYFYLYIISGIFSTYKDSAGMWHEDRFRPLIGAFVNLGLNIAFVGKYGIYAILLSTIISYIFINIPWLIYNIFHILFKCSPKKYLVKLFIYTLVSFAACIVTAKICKLVIIGGIFGIAIKLIICVLVSNLMFFCIYRRTSEYNHVMYIIRRILRRNDVENVN